jgi:hypothetical protein
MLKKAAVKECKDWDKMLPYFLFAYREVPHSSTGFSPFELVNGPLDVLRQTWEESVISHILLVREKLSKMHKLAKQTLLKAQTKQKQWYDQKASEREFAVGDGPATDRIK